MFNAQKVIVRLAVLSLIPYIIWLVKQNDRIWIVKSVSLFSFLRTIAKTQANE